jgi:hypothetical protein
MRDNATVVDLADRGLVYVIAALASVLIGGGLVYSPRGTLAVAAASCTAALAAVRPAWFGAGIVVALLFPYTWSPSLTGGPTPVVVLFALPGAVAGGLALLHSGRLRPNLLDGVIVCLVASAFLSELMTFHGHRYSLELVKAALLPYVAFRIVFAASPSAMRSLPEALIWVGVAVSAIAVWEVVAGGNPFLHGPVNEALARWAVNVHRGGVIRAAATFGHPIALGSFLVAPIVIAFAQERWRVLTVLAIGELLTLSRGPWIATIVAVVLYASLTRGLHRLWLIGVALIIAGLFVGPVRHVVSASFQSGTVEQANATYRTQLIGSAFDSLTVWGNPRPDTQPSFLLSELRPTDMTSEPALIASKQGLSGLIVWLALLGALVAATITSWRRRTYFLLPLAVAAIGMWVAMLSVALITTFAVTFWLIVACVATAWSEQRGSPRTLTNPASAARLATGDRLADAA